MSKSGSLKKKRRNFFQGIFISAMCTGIKGSQNSDKLHMRSSSFAIRCAFFNGIDSVTQTRQLMPPEKPLGSLQLHLQIGTGLPQVLCHSSQPEQTPQVVEDTSNATRQPCADNQVSPHPSSYTSHAALSQKVSCTSVPGELFSPDTH